MGYHSSGRSPGVLPGPAGLAICSRSYPNHHRTRYFCTEVSDSLEKLKAQWLETNWDTLLRTLAADLQPAGPLTSAGEVDTAVDHLIGAIQHSAEGNIPIARITPYSRPEYPQELKRLRNEVNRTRRWAASGQEEDIKTFRRARNTLSRATVKLNRGSHRTQVEDATESVEGFWKLACWACCCGAV